MERTKQVCREVGDLLTLRGYLHERLNSVEVKLETARRNHGYGTATTLARRLDITASAWHRLVKRTPALEALGEMDADETTWWCTEAVDRWVKESGYQPRRRRR